MHSTIRELSRNALERADVLVARVTEQVINGESELADGSVVPVADVTDTISQLMRNFYLHLAEGVAPDMDAVRAVGRRRAQQGVPLPAVLHGFRIGFRLAWKYLVDQVAPDDVGAMHALVEQADRMWLLLDDYSGELRDAYRERAAELLRFAEAERHRHLDALLSPGVDEIGRKSASAEALGLARTGRYLVIVARGAGLADQADWEAALDARGARVLWRDSPEATIGVVSAGRAPCDWAELPDRLSIHARTRLGASETFTSVEAAARALHQARLALGSVPRDGSGIRRYAQDALGCLAAASPDDALDLARITLRALASLPGYQRDTLLDTLAAWLDAGGSADDAAKALYCHRNTVRYRLRRIEELTGLQLGDPRDVSQLYFAMRAIEQQGRAMLAKP